MRNHFLSPARRMFVAALCGVWVVLLAGGFIGRGWAATVAGAPLATSLGALPLSFEPNVGQFDDGLSFFVRGAGCSIAVAPTEVTLLLPGKERAAHTAAVRRSARGTERKAKAAGPSRTVKFELVGGNKSARATGEAPLPGIVNYLLGNDPSVWKTGIATFERARFARVYPGIDLVYYGNQSRLEYDFILAPHANPRLIRLQFTGADELTLDAAGDLLVHLDGKQLRWQKPVAFQTIGGERRTVAASYRLAPGGHVAFDLGDYDASHELTIDPLLIYSTYLGGSDLDSAQAMTVDAWGNIYLAGGTYSTNFPVFRAYRTNPYAYSDAFVTKLNSNATALVFSTYFGGGSNDWANAIAVDSGSNVFIAGFTDSLNLPLRNAYQGSVGSFGDAFLTRFGPFGSNLVYSTYYGDGGGSIAEYEEAFALAVNNSGNAWIAGATASGSALNNKAPFQNGFGGGFQDALVARFDTAQSGGGSLTWASWLGGNYSDVAYGIAVDTNNNCYVVGTMFAEFDDFGEILPATFPVLNAYQPTFGGGFNDAFLVKIDSSGNPGRVFATFLGGADDDSAYGVTVNGLGQAHVVGETASQNFPTFNGHRSVHADGGVYSDAFVTKFNAAGSGLLYSSYFGGTRSEGARSVVVDRFGHIYVAGYTQSGNLAVTPDAVQLSLGGIVGDDADLFAAKFNPSIPGPSSLIFATYYGGSDREAFSGDFDFWSLFAPGNIGIGLGVDTNLNIYLASDTFSTNLPPAGGATYRTTAVGEGDSFAVKLSSPVDVSVAMTVATNVVIVGSNLLYTVYANNNGLSTFTNVIATDVLPAKLQFVAATNSLGVVSNAGNTVFLAYGNLTNNAARQSTVLAKAIAPGVITNVINLTATPGDLNTNNNRSQVVTTIRGVANLSLSVVATPNPVLSSSNVTFTLSVTNHGPWPATDILLTNLVPAGVSYVSAIASQGPTAIAGGLVYAFIGTLASNAIATVTIVFEAGSTAGPLNNYAGVYQYELDPVPANNNAVIAVTVNALTDAIIGLSTNSFTGPALYVSSNLTYRIFVTNNGPSTAGSVFVTNRVPAGASYVSAVSSSGTCTQFQGVVTCALGNMTSNATATITVITRPGSVGLITNSAVIVSSATDPILANNTSSAVSLVNPLADLALTMTVPGGQVIVTSNLVYSLTVSNRGPTFATNVVIANPLPAQSQFVTASVSQGTAQLVGNSVMLNLGQINPSAGATATVTLRPFIEGATTNIATVSAGVFDPVAANNTASAITTITNHPDGPILRIARIGSSTNVLLYWTTNSAGYFLQSNTNLLSAASWVSNTTLPVIRGTQYQVTNSIGLLPRHYRLRKTLAPPAFGPLLSVRLSGTNVQLLWPANPAGFSLQSSPAVLPGNWSYVSNTPALTGGLFFVSLPNTSTWRFFRLIYINPG